MIANAESRKSTNTSWDSPTSKGIVAAIAIARRPARRLNSRVATVSTETSRDRPDTDVEEQPHFLPDVEEEVQGQH